MQASIHCPPQFPAPPYLQVLTLFLPHRHFRHVVSFLQLRGIQCSFYIPYLLLLFFHFHVFPVQLISLSQLLPPLHILHPSLPFSPPLSPSYCHSSAFSLSPDSIPFSLPFQHLSATSCQAVHRTPQEGHISFFVFLSSLSLCYWSEMETLIRKGGGVVGGWVGW